MSDTTTVINADLDTLRAWVGTVTNEANSMLRMCLDVAKRKAHDDMYETHLDHPDVQLGIIMYAARQFKRRQSVEGVAGWGDLGVVRILASDPDIDRLWGPHRDPSKAAGFGLA